MRRTVLRLLPAGGLLALALPLVLATTQGDAKRGDDKPKDEPPAKTITLQDRENFYQGSYLAYASPWSTFVDTAMKRGEDFFDTITVNPETFPDGTVINSRWPTLRPMKTGVWGYHAVSFGRYDGGDPPEKVEPKQVKAIEQLVQCFKFSYKNSPNFNLLNEFYLTSAPGDTKAKVIEIGFFLHLPPNGGFDELSAKTKITRFKDSSYRDWVITRGEKFVTIFPEDGRDVTEGTIDVREFLKVLIDNGVITGNEWFNGIAFGMEPTRGGGQTELTVERWKVFYK